MFSVLQALKEREYVMILVSACLCGVHCRYDGKAKPDEEIMALMREGRAIPVCPEQLGGLPVPRPPAEIMEGDGEAVLNGSAQVYNRLGQDVTQAFIMGAEETLHIASLSGAHKAILKANSPSCGAGVIYDGTFSGTTREGDGVAAALLRKNGIEVEAR